MDGFYFAVTAAEYVCDIIIAVANLDALVFVDYKNIFVLVKDGKIGFVCRLRQKNFDFAACRHRNIFVRPIAVDDDVLFAEGGRQ